MASWVLHQGCTTSTTDDKTFLRSTTICGRSLQVRVAEQAQKKMQKLMQEEAEVQQDHDLLWTINLVTAFSHPPRKKETQKREP